MTSHEIAVLPIRQQPVNVVKQKNAGPMERRNRRALGDIGNLAIVPGVETGKPPQINRPITRNFRKQLVSNAKAAADKNVKKTQPEAKKGDVAKKNNEETPKRRSQKPSKQLVSNAQAAADKNVKKTQPEAKKGDVAKKNNEETPERRSQKPSKSLTSVLTARSKLACGITTKPKDPVVNIDEADANNELAEVEYVEDIYRFYKLSETEGGLRDYMSSQPNLNAKMRAILINWLVEVHGKFRLMPESLYQTINIIDRYLSVRTVPRVEFQLVGISALLMACKYEEIWPPQVDDLIALSDYAYCREQILAMEKAILGHLGWFLTVPTPYVFLVRYTKASLPSDSKMENMVFFLAELGLMRYSIIMTNSPSKLAASAVYAARCTLNKTPAWTETLKHHTGYYEDEVKECAKSLVSYHACASEKKLNSVYEKFLTLGKGAVALFPPAKIL